MWNEVDGFLVREWKFANFKEAWDFVDKVGELAEKANHHPDIEFGWGHVKIKLRTHSEDAITDKDRNLAAQIDAL
jgi:4a-hydroxytetrahydrobiopterin dehydratase